MKKDRYIGAYGILINDNKIALITKKGGPYKGKLDLPGGGFEYGETPNQTVTREIKEELGIEILNAKLFDASSFITAWNHKGNQEEMYHIALFYTIKFNTLKLKSTADGFDSLGADWYEINNLKENEVSPLVWYIIDKRLNLLY